MATSKKRSKNCRTRKTEVIYCTQCGAPVASQDVILELENILQVRGPGIVDMLKLCPTCKAKMVVGERDAFFTSPIS